MSGRCWVGVCAVAGLLACGDDAASITAGDSDDASTAGTGSTTGAQDSSSGPAVTSSATGSSTGSSSSETTGSTTQDGSSSDTTTGGPAAEIVVHTVASGQTVVASTADGTVLDSMTSDARGIARFPSADVTMLSALDQQQWTSIAGVEAGDELWMTWRPLPDTTVLGTLQVELPADNLHPTPDDPGFTQVSIGCGDAFGGAPPGTPSVTLDIEARCITESGHLNVIAYAQGGPSITVVATASLLEVEWTAGEMTVVSLGSWDGVLDDLVYATSDPVSQPVVNTTHTQWIEGVEFPMPRRSALGGTRLFPADAPVDWLQHTGSTDLGDGPSRMSYAQRRTFDGADYEFPTTALLLPEVEAASASQEDGRWTLSVSGPRPFDEADAILMQTRWLGGFWAVMTPADQRSVTLPVLPDTLTGTGPGPSDTLDTPFVVIAEADAYEGYDEFRSRGAWFFSGPGILPDVDESLVRGTVFFPVPF